MTLRVNPAGDRQAQKVHRRRLFCAVWLPPKHHGANLYATDTTRPINFHCKRLSGILQWRDMRQHCTRVHIDRMAANWLHNWHAHFSQGVAQIGSRSDAVLQIILFDHFLETHGNGLWSRPDSPP